MKSQIHLIRHGITEGNQRRLYYGAADIPLAKEGERMLKELVAEHIYPEAEGSDFYTTGLIRTEQTLTLIYGEKEHSVIEELREMNFGQFEMKSYQELKEVPAYIEWAGDKTGTLASPDGESIVEFRKRIENGFDILMGRHQLKELSVRHSGKGRVFYGSLPWRNHRFDYGILFPGKARAFLQMDSGSGPWVYAGCESRRCTQLWRILGGYYEDKRICYRTDWKYAASAAA